jgi:branched-chain amino acid transport system substrate-binding protein
MIVESTRGPWRHRTALGTAVLSMLALLAACAGSSSAKSSPSTSSGSSGTTEPTQPAPTGTPLKLGFILDKSGPNGPGQGDVGGKVADAWVKYTNSHGGVAGHPVELKITDTKGDPANGQSTATEYANDKSLIATLLMDSAGESSYAKALSDGGLPVVGGLGYYPTVWSSLPNLFGITTTFPSVVNMQPVSAQKVGAKKVGAAVCAEVDSCSLASSVFKSAAEKIGLTYTGTVKVAASAPSFTAECLQFVNNKTDFIQFSAGASVGVRMYKDCVQQGFSGYLGASAGTVISTLYQGDSNLKMAGALNAFPWWTSDPPVVRFRNVMAAEGVSEKDYGAPTATATYASLELFKKAMEAAKATLPASPGRQDVLNAYGAVKSETLDGLLPQPLTFTAGQPGPKVTCFWLYTYGNGKFTGDLTPTCDTAS